MRFTLLLLIIPSAVFSQLRYPHANAHAHNDYEHRHPLKDALRHGFISVEADVHVHQGQLLVGHNRVSESSLSLERLYFAPLDSILRTNNNRIYPDDGQTFYLMVDIKTAAAPAYQLIGEFVKKYPSLSCTGKCPVKIFLSGNRPVETITREGYRGIALDGRPEDLGKGYSSEIMPVISDNFNKWSGWNGKTDLRTEDLDRIRKLAATTHAEGKKLRLWAIPDTEVSWKALMDAGVDLINTDDLEGLHKFLTSK
jgi:hypothetical protein